MNRRYKGKSSATNTGSKQNVTDKNLTDLTGGGPIRKTGRDGHADVVHRPRVWAGFIKRSAIGSPGDNVRPLAYLCTAALGHRWEAHD